MKRRDLCIDDVIGLPLPGVSAPSGIAFSPDGAVITALASAKGDLTNQLYAFDPETGSRRLWIDPAESGVTEENVSPEEALRRERERQRALGVTHYAWAADANRLLIPLRGGIYVADVDLGDEARSERESQSEERAGLALRELVAGADVPCIDARFSPDGEWVAYVRDAELYVVPFAGGEPRQVTFGARGTGKTHGLAEYVAQEEMGRSHGFWWSQDGQWLAFTEVDETHIPIYRIVHQGKSQVGEHAQEDHRYPFAGGDNARVRLGIVSVKGGDPVWVDLEEEQYLARVEWLPDGDLSAQVENREQTEIRLLRIVPVTGQQSVLLSEKTEIWINLNDLFRPLAQGFMWASERTGFRHLYLYAWDGSLVRALTQGAWMVDDVVGVDEKRGRIYFTATLDSPLTSHLYVVGFEGGEPCRLTTGAGTHTVVMDRDCTRYVDTYHSLEQPPTVTVYPIESVAPVLIRDNADPRVVELALESPELVSLTNRDGTLLYGAVYRPSERFGHGPFPTIVSVYGGPHAQTVVNGWRMTVSMRAQYLRSLGFLVFVLDNRGSARRGLAFESAVKHDMGHVEVDDQVDGVQWLVDGGLSDPDRVGVMGWSYGGYMAAMCLCRAPDTSKVAVAGAPVTHWDGYDTHYTERYMGTPQSNPQGYKESSVLYHVVRMEGKLLLVHGLIDENVHFRHTARLINALIAAGKPYDLVLLPDSRHGPRREADRIYLERRISAYLMQYL